MIDFEKFKTSIPHPVRNDFNEIVTVKSSKGEERRVIFFDSEGFEEAKKVHNNENAYLRNLFFADLKEHLGIEDNPKADLLISKAVDASGGDFRAIADWCEDMVDLIL